MIYTLFKNASLQKALVFSVALLGILLVFSSKPVSAAYDGGNIIDNSTFLNTNSMSIASIQSLLTSKNSGLANKSFVLNCYAHDSKERQWYSAAGAPCDQNVPASYIIFYAAKVYGINPQVILATLQKEQSLITSPNPTDWQINQAMGYGCPTTGGCGASTFFYQIDNGTWVLRYHYERANRNFNWWTPSSTWTCGTEKNFYKPNLYPGQNVNFFDEDGVHYRTHFISNAATSSLYCYTPHAYNNPQGLYGRAPYGTTGRYYSGSYNFVTFFELWFGPTNASNCRYPTTEANGVFRLYNKGTGNHLLTESAAEVCAATRAGYLYDGRMFTSEASQGLPVFRLERGGRYLFTTSTSERDAAVSLHGFRLEGVSFYGVNPITNPSEARPVYRLTNSIGTYTYTISGYERDALIKRGYRYEGVGFYLKENSGITVSSTYRLAHPNGIYLFTLSPTERDSAVQTYGYRLEGVGMNAVTQMNPIMVPVYRLAGKNGYILTTSLAERIDASNLGYRDEGIGMYTYGAMNDPGLKKVYRLSSKNGSYLYTTSEAERDVAAQRYGYRIEGIGFLTP